MKQTLKPLISYSWGLLSSASLTWDKISSENLNVKQARQLFLYPWIGICIFFALVFKSLYASDKFIQTGIFHSIILAISLFGGYFLSKKVCFWYLRKYQKSDCSVNSCEKIIIFSFTTVFLIKIVTTIFPGLFFLQILNIYVAYLVWEGCRAVLNLNEDERGNLVFTLTICIIFSPVIISKCIQLMLYYA